MVIHILYYGIQEHCTHIRYEGTCTHKAHTHSRTHTHARAQARHTHTHPFAQTLINLCQGKVFHSFSSFISHACPRLMLDEHRYHAITSRWPLSQGIQTPPCSSYKHKGLSTRGSMYICIHYGRKTRCCIANQPLSPSFLVQWEKRRLWLRVCTLMKYTGSFCYKSADRLERAGPGEQEPRHLPGRVRLVTVLMQWGHHFIPAQKKYVK